MGLGAVFGGLQLAGGLFGGDNGGGEAAKAAAEARRRQYGALGDANIAANHQSSLAGNMEGYGTTALGEYGGDNAQARADRAAYLDKLSVNPYASEQGRGGYLARATAGTTDAYNAARAKLASSNYARGLDTPSSAGPSSVSAGGNAAIDADQARTLAQANAGWADTATQYDQNAARERYGVTTDAANADYSRGMSALGDAAGTYGAAGNAYGNIANSYAGYGASEQARGDALGNARNQSILGGAAAIGQAYGQKDALAGLKKIFG